MDCNGCKYCTRSARGEVKGQQVHLPNPPHCTLWTKYSSENTNTLPPHTPHTPTTLSSHSHHTLPPHPHTHSHHTPTIHFHHTHTHIHTHHTPTTHRPNSPTTDPSHSHHTHHTPTPHRPHPPTLPHTPITFPPHTHHTLPPHSHHTPTTHRPHTPTTHTPHFHHTPYTPITLPSHSHHTPTTLLPHSYHTLTRRFPDTISVLRVEHLPPLLRLSTHWSRQVSECRWFSKIQGLQQAINHRHSTVKGAINHTLHSQGGNKPHIPQSRGQ